MARSRIVFRCDASPEIGGGHVVRCLALAHAFRAAGAEVTFAVSDETPRTVPELAAQFPETARGFTGETAELERLEPVDVIVIDHYGLGFEYEVAASSVSDRLLVIDDFPNRQHAATHLVDTTHGRVAAEYAPVVGKDTVVMCGSDYAMLRPPFRARRPVETTAPTPPLNILATFGMTDSHNVSGMAAEALSDFARGMSLSFVLGASAPHLYALRNTIRKMGHDWRIVTDADAEQMAELTAKADLVIGAPGSASYERCCLGKPTLLVQVADNQAGNAASLVEAGAARLVGSVPHVGPAEIGEAVSELLSQPEELGRMSAAALRVTDGNGVDRIVAATLTPDGR